VEFGVGGYDPGQLDEIFGLLRGLRVAAGDFAGPAPAAGAGAGTGTEPAAARPPDT